jgi:hypothetical protein
MRVRSNEVHNIYNLHIKYLLLYPSDLDFSFCKMDVHIISNLL